MALAVVAVVPPATMAGIYYWIVIHDGSPLMAYPAVLAMLSILRALIRGWLRRPPVVRGPPERSGPSQPIPAEAWDALATLATQQADQSRQSTEAGAADRLVEVVTETVGRDHGKHLVLLGVPLVHAPVGGVDAVRLELVTGPTDIGHSDGGAISAGVAAGEGEADAHAVPFQDHRRHGVVAPVDLDETEPGAVPVRGPVDVVDRQREQVGGEGKRGFVESLGGHVVTRSDHPPGQSQRPYRRRHFGTSRAPWTHPG